MNNDTVTVAEKSYDQEGLLLDELWERIFMLLDQLSLVSVCRVSRRFNTFVQKNSKLLLRRDGVLFDVDTAPQLSYVFSRSRKKLISGGQSNWPGEPNTVKVTNFEDTNKRVVHVKVENDETVSTADIDTYFALCVWHKPLMPAPILYSVESGQMSFYFGDGDIHCYGHHVFVEWIAQKSQRRFKTGDVIGVEVGIKDFSLDPDSWRNFVPKYSTDEQRQMPVNMGKMYYLRTIRNSVQSSPWLVFPAIPITTEVFIGFSPKGHESITILDGVPDQEEAQQ